MDERTGILPGLPQVAGKPVHLAFDRGLMTSDAGILLLAAIEQRLAIVKRSADCLEDRRDPERVRHTVAKSSSANARLATKPVAMPATKQRRLSRCVVSPK
jgi:hypothetical protein